MPPCRRRTVVPTRWSISRALICTDLVLNIRDEPSLLTRLLYRALGVWRRPGATSYYRKQTRDRAAMAAALDRVLAWDIGQLVMAHGDVLPVAGPDQLRAVLGR